ncbi:hypothetical protein ABZ192_38240 [Streptomyces sp. NPDC006235]|uniref:hypothetical protein n=1 Tax=Streptomyces sp. NPDC006235 TaxID=3156736 RepID=UPI0033A1FA15
MPSHALTEAAAAAAPVYLTAAVTACLGLLALAVKLVLRKLKQRRQDLAGPLQALTALFTLLKVLDTRPTTAKDLELIQDHVDVLEGAVLRRKRLGKILDEVVRLAGAYRAIELPEVGHRLPAGLSASALYERSRRQGTVARELQAAVVAATERIGRMHRR